MPDGEDRERFSSGIGIDAQDGLWRQELTAGIATAEHGFCSVVSRIVHGETRVDDRRSLLGIGGVSEFQDVGTIQRVQARE